MTSNPLNQFLIKKIIVLNIYGMDISITNSSCFMFISVILAITYFIISINKKLLLPSRLQVSAELLYDFINGLLVGKDLHGPGKRFFGIIFSLFIFILLCNLLGMLPYSFTVTSHIIVTFSLAFLVFCMITIVGFLYHGLAFFSLFLPHGVPLWLSPLIVVIEIFSYLAKPISLSLRLTANMIAGHVLLKVIGGFAVTLTLFYKILPISIMTLLVGFEICVAILQAYIFTILTCVYLNDVINLHQ